VVDQAHKEIMKTYGSFIGRAALGSDNSVGNWDAYIRKVFECIAAQEQQHPANMELAESRDAVIDCFEQQELGHVAAVVDPVTGGWVSYSPPIIWLWST
jgi:hypothetical protein